MSRLLAVLSLVTLAACGSSSLIGEGAFWTPGRNAAVAAPKEAASGGRVRNLLLRPTQTAPGLPTRHFREGTRNVFCTFDVRGVAPGTAVTVHWLQSGRELARNDLSTERHTRSLSAAMRAQEALSPGSYELEVRVAETVEARTTFSIVGEPSEDDEAESSTTPEVSGLTLNTSEECAPGEGGSSPRPRTFRGGVRLVQLCLSYANIPPGQRLEVRWLRRNVATPLSTSTYQASGSGDLTSSFTHDPEIEPGSYRVSVTLDGREIGRAIFVIRR